MVLKRLSFLWVCAVLFGAPALAQDAERFGANVHYVILDKPVPVRDPGKIEVVIAFSYGCPPCFAVEPLASQWMQEMRDDVDAWLLPAVWNEPMNLYARTYYTAHDLGVVADIHAPLFRAVVVEQQKLSNVRELAGFFAQYDIEPAAFTDLMHSSSVSQRAREAEARVRAYKLASVPEIIVNGRYRIDRMRAGGLREMFDVANHLIERERATSNP